MEREQKLKILTGLTKIGLGLIEEGIATPENVIQKTKDYLDKEGLLSIIPPGFIETMQIDILTSIKAKTHHPTPSAPNEVKPPYGKQ